MVEEIVINKSLFIRHNPKNFVRNEIAIFYSDVLVSMSKWVKGVSRAYSFLIRFDGTNESKTSYLVERTIIVAV